jgi:AcrR family transcriptional regulator
MPKRDIKYMADRRREILDAASRCLDRLGIASTSTKEICREAGISMGALYTHFKSRDDIILAIAERSAEDMGSNMGITTITELRKLLLRRLRDIYRPGYAATIRIEVQMLAEAVANRSVAKEVMDNYRISRKMIHGALERISKVGGLAEGGDPETAATLVENFHYGLLFRRAAGCAEPREAAEAALESLLLTITGQALFRERGDMEDVEA